jgi:transcriptional regulator with XRE-family HTH domain
METKNKTLIASNISYLREKQLGMRKDFFAKTIGVTSATVIGWESGKRIPQPAKLMALCDFFNSKFPGLKINANDLLERPLALDYYFSPPGDLDILDDAVIDHGEPYLSNAYTEQFYQKIEVLLSDKKLLDLIRVTPEEVDFLKSLRFDPKFIPTKQFYIDILHHFRNFRKPDERLR